MTFGKTIARFSAGEPTALMSAGFTINPGIFHIEWIDPTEFSLTNALWLRYSPGWFPFGPTGGSTPFGTLDVPLTTSSYLPQVGPRQHGVNIYQNDGYLFGLAQQVFNAELLRGRRIRVTACYTIPGAPAQQTAVIGLSAWLKGKVTGGVSTIGSGAWTAGGRGYSKVKVTGSPRYIVDIKHQGEALNGECQSLFIPALDELQFDGVDEHIYFRSPKGGASDGVVNRDDLTVYYLNDDFSGVPATDGTFELVTDVPGSAGVKFLDFFVDVPDSADLFEDGECWICLFPVSPASVGSMLQDAQIDLWYFNIEVVSKDTSVEETLGGMFLALQQENPLSTRYLLRNPMYFPKSVPLSVYAITGNFGTGADTPFKVDRSVELQASVQLGDAASASPGPWDFVVPLPWGAVVLKASYQLDRSSGLGVVGDAWLEQIMGMAPSAGGGTLTLNRRQLLVDFPSGGTTGVQTEEAVRNRIGNWFPETLIVDPDPSLLLGTMGAAHGMFHFEGNAGNTEWALQSGYVLCLVDPRLANAHWKVGP